MSSQIPLDVRSAVARLEKAPRKFASTMPMFPHHYTTDFMSYGSGTWISDYNYEKLLHRMTVSYAPTAALGAVVR